MVLTTDDAKMNSGDLSCVYIDYKKLPKSTDVGRFIFVDDGQLRFQVTEVNEKEGWVKVKAMNTWKISNNKGVNLPMVPSYFVVRRYVVLTIHVDDGGVACVVGEGQARHSVRG